MVAYCGALLAFSLSGLATDGCVPLGDLDRLRKAEEGGGSPNGGSSNFGGEGGGGGAGGGVLAQCLNEDLGPTEPACGGECQPCGVDRTCLQAGDCATGLCGTLDQKNVCAPVTVPGWVPISSYDHATDETPNNDLGGCRSGPVELQELGVTCFMVGETGEQVQLSFFLQEPLEVDLIPQINALSPNTAITIRLDGDAIGFSDIIPERSSQTFSRPNIALGELKSGFHSLEFEIDAGSAQIGDFELLAHQEDLPIKVDVVQQAEYGDIQTARVSSSVAGYDGDGYAYVESESEFSVVVDVERAGYHQLELSYAGLDDTTPIEIEIEVSGAPAIFKELTPKVNFSSSYITDAWFDRGANHVTLRGKAGTVLVDSVQVKAAARNLSRLRQTSASSSSSSYPAAFAVDGDPATYFLSEPGLQEWVQVDLQMESCVSSVILHPRQTGYQERLDGAKLRMSVDGMMWFDRNLAAGPTEAESFEFIGRTARYVRLQLSDSDYLNVGEIEVLGTTQPCGARPIGEFKKISASQSTRFVWNSIAFDRRYLDPIVVLGPPSYENVDPIVTRLADDVASAGVSFQFAEWEYRNGVHPTEGVGVFIIERGAWEADNSLLWASQATASSTPSVVSLPGIFTGTPVVMGQVASASDAGVTSHRYESLSRSSFTVRLFEQAASSDPVHGAELFNFVAIEPGVSPKSSLCQRPGELGQSFVTFDFDQSFADTPVLMADIMSNLDARGVGMRYQSLSGASVQLRLEPENSAGVGALMAQETIAYCASPPGAFWARSVR